MCLLHESPGRVSLPAQPSLGTVSGRCHLLQFEVLLPVYITVGNIHSSSIGKTAFRIYSGILTLYLFSLDHKVQESSEKEMHIQALNTMIPNDAMYLQSTCSCPYWLACWGNPYSTPITQLFWQRQLKGKYRQSSVCSQQSLSSIFHKFSQLSTYSTCYIHLKLLIYKTWRIRSFDPTRKRYLCQKLVLVLVTIKSHNYSSVWRESVLLLPGISQFTNTVCLGVGKLRYRISARIQTYYAYTLLFQLKHSHLI